MASDPTDRPSIEQTKSHWEALVVSLALEAESPEDVPAQVLPPASRLNVTAPMAAEQDEADLRVAMHELKVGAVSLSSS